MFTEAVCSTRGGRVIVFCSSRSRSVGTRGDAVVVLCRSAIGIVFLESALVATGRIADMVVGCPENDERVELASSFVIFVLPSTFIATFKKGPENLITASSEDKDWLRCIDVVVIVVEVRAISDC